jgi:exopolysaccharide biosynthesis polyprenyl glycosylphosphotransferase
VVALDEREIESIVTPATTASTLPSNSTPRSTRPRRAQPAIAADALTWSAIWSITLWIGFGPESPHRAAATAALAATVVAGSVWIAASLGTYRTTVTAVPAMAYATVVRAVVIASTLLVVAVRLFDIAEPLGICVVGGAAAAVAAVVTRAWAEHRHRQRRSSGREIQRVLLVADDEALDGLLALLDDHVETGWRVCAVVGACRDRTVRHQLPWLGGLNDAAATLEAVRPDLVVVAATTLRNEEGEHVLNELRRRDVPVHLDIGLRGIDHRRLRVIPVAHEPLLVVRALRPARYQQLAKRVVDVIVSVSVLTLTAPLLACAALAIKLDDGGPVLFRQLRVGRNGHAFRILKLRTMSTDAERRLASLQHLNEREGGPLFKLTTDPRVTRVGRLLRALSIDELPQLWNVVVGQMSLVGPRPALPSEAASFDRRLATRHNVPPGVTGLWQVEGRDNPSFEEYRRLDVFYVENWSLLLDITILCATVPAVIGRGWRSLRRDETPSPELVSSELI